MLVTFYFILFFEKKKKRRERKKKKKKREKKAFRFLWTLSIVFTYLFTRFEKQADREHVPTRPATDYADELGFPSPV